MWHHYMPETSNWHGGIFTPRWIAALSAAPTSYVPPVKLKNFFLKNS
jgi:hypothetical protein